MCVERREIVFWRVFVVRLIVYIRACLKNVAGVILRIKKAGRLNPAFCYFFKTSKIAEHLSISSTLRVIICKWFANSLV